MKIVRSWLYLLGAVVLVLAVVLAASSANSGAASRFTALAPAGQGGGPSGNGAAAPAQQGPVVITAVKSDLSAPLSSVKPIRGQPNAVDADQNQILPLGNRNKGSDAAARGFRDPALQEGPVGQNIGAPLVSFEGVNNINGVLPPDTNGDIGPNHYMQWVNLSFAVYNRSGTLLYGPAAGNTLWSGFGGVCQSYNNGDPIVLYDAMADRWLASQFALPGGASGYHQCVAVSQTGDPTGAWYRYDFLWSSINMNDYPHFGVWPDGYYISVNQFANGATWAGQGVGVFERSAMLTGSPTARLVLFDMYGVDPNLGGMLPSDLDGATLPPSGAPNVFAEIDDDAWGYSPDQVQLWEFHVDWTNTANSTFTFKQALGTAAFDTNMCAGARNCIPEPGTTAKLDAIADRLMYRLQYRNFGTYQTLVTNHTVDVDGTDRAGARWYELRKSGSTWSINQQGTFSPDSTDRWMGSAAMDGLGNIGLGYSISSSSIYPSIRYTGRAASDPAGTLPQGEGTLMNGTGSQTHSASRWGDYSMLAVDPVDDCTFWFTSEYIQTTGSAPWRTRIGSFQLPGCGSPPPSSTGLKNPTANAAETSGAGDNNGYQTSPTNAYTDNATFAVDTNSGTTTSTSCTDAGKDKHRFYNYGFGLTGTPTISGIEVRLDARVDNTTGAPKICVQLSWDGGTSWTAAQNTPTLTTGEATYLLGGSSNTWGRTWSVSDLSDANFRVRIIDVASRTARDFSLDWAAVNVYYTP